MYKVISIEFFRFIFMLQICLWHYNSCLGLMKNGYIAVEFFFILSGFLIYKSFSKPCSKDIISFTKAKLNAFLPKIVISFLLFGFTFYAVIIDNPEKIINDLFLLSGTGLVKGSGINSPIWYISVLVFGGAFIYALLKKMENIAISVIFPLIVLLVYTYILNNNNYNLELWTTIGCFYMPFWRGVADMCLGCILGHLYIDYLRKLDSSKYISLFNILFLIAFIGYCFSIFITTHYDGYILICCAILVLGCFSEKCIINKYITQKIWIVLGRISFDMLILHVYVLRFIYKMENMDIIEKNNNYNILIYIILLLTISISFHISFQKFFHQYTDKIFH